MRDGDGLLSLPAMRCEPRHQSRAFSILFEIGNAATKEVRSVPPSVPHRPHSGMRIHYGAVIDADQWVAAAHVHSPRLGCRSLPAPFSRCLQYAHDRLPPPAAMHHRRHGSDIIVVIIAVIDIARLEAVLILACCCTCRRSRTYTLHGVVLIMRRLAALPMLELF